MKKQIQLGFGLSLIVAAALFVFSNTSRTQAEFANMAEVAVDAKTIFVSKCASCHGKDGRAKTFRGKLSHARNLADSEWQNNVSDERLFNSISNGRNKMPSFKKKLSEAEIDSLVTYVRRLKK